MSGRRLPLVMLCLVLPSWLLLTQSPTPVAASEPPTPKPAIVSNATGWQVGQGNEGGFQQQVQSIELIGQVGGTVNGVAVQANYAYVGTGPRLVALDISNPSVPKVIGRSAPLPDLPNDLAIAGDYVYAAAGSAGLRIIKGANPAVPVEVGYVSIPGYAWQVAVAGAYAYVAAGYSGLRIIDVSTPTNPREVGCYCGLSPYFSDVAVSGNYAYVAADDSGLRVIDISIPTSPREVGMLSQGVAGQIRPRRVVASGDYVYMKNDYPTGKFRRTYQLMIVNASNPSQPVRAGSYDTPGEVTSLAVAGSYAYITDSYSGLTVLEVSDPASPIKVGGVRILTGDAPTVALGSHHAFIADSRSALQVIDISNPTAPTAAGSYRALQGGALAIAGKFVYTGDSSGPLHVVDTTNPANPLEVGAYEQVQLSVSIAAAGNYLYASSSTKGLHIFDVSNPANAVHVSYYDAFFVQGIAVANNYAYIADLSFGLRVLDVSNPANPIQIGSLRIEGDTRSLAIAGNYVYLVNSSSSPLVIDVSNPANPVQIATMPILASKVLVDGAYLYVTGGYPTGLRIFDVTNPAIPTQIAAYQFPGSGDVTVAGNYGYFAQSSVVPGAGVGVRVIDLSNKRNATDVGWFTIPGGAPYVAQHVAAAGPYVYATGNAGLFILHFSGAGPGPSIPNLSVGLLAADRVNQGDALSYFILLENTDKSGISVAVTDTIPLNTTPIMGTVSGGAVYSDTINSILWTGTVPPGLSSLPSAFLSFRVSVGNPVSAGTIANTLIVSDGSNTIMATAATKVFRRTFLPSVLWGTAAW